MPLRLLFRDYLRERWTLRRRRTCVVSVERNPVVPPATGLNMTDGCGVHGIEERGIRARRSCLRNVPLVELAVAGE